MSEIHTFLFKYKNLEPVLKEGFKNRCSFEIAKDSPGLYILSSIGERDSKGSQVHVAYAEGFNAEIDDPSMVSQILDNELGDDFGEFITHRKFLAELLLCHTFKMDLIVTFSKTHYGLKAVLPEQVCID